MINKLFNKKQLDLLKDAEEYFRQVRSGFKRNSPHALDVRVYETLNSIEPTQEPKYSCSKCVFTLYKKASEIYFQSKEKIDDEKKKFYENEQPEQTEPKPAKSRYKPRATQKENKVKGKKGSSNK